MCKRCTQYEHTLQEARDILLEARTEGYRSHVMARLFSVLGVPFPPFVAAVKEWTDDKRRDAENDPSLPVCD